MERMNTKPLRLLLELLVIIPLTILFALIALSLRADDEVVPLPPVPEITAEQANAYNRADRDVMAYIAAHQDLHDMLERRDKAAAAMQATCGTRGVVADPAPDKIGFKCGEAPKATPAKTNK